MALEFPSRGAPRARMRSVRRASGSCWSTRALPVARYVHIGSVLVWLLLAFGLPRCGASALPAQSEVQSRLPRALLRSQGSSRNTLLPAGNGAADCAPVLCPRALWAICENLSTVASIVKPIARASPPRSASLCPAVRLGAVSLGSPGSWPHSTHVSRLGSALWSLYAPLTRSHALCVPMRKTSKVSTF